MADPVSRLETMYREHAGALLGYLHRSFGRSASAEDLLQETFLQALRHHARLESARSPRAWLFSVARHVGLTALRQKRTEPLPGDLPARPSAAEDPRLEKVRQAMAQLPEDHRQTLDLRLCEQMSYEEIAEAMSIPVGTVRSRLHHAVRKLREAVAQEANQ